MSKRKKQFLPDALIERLGSIPDAHLAKEYGVGARTVTRARNQRGIPSNKTSVHLTMVKLIHEMIRDGELMDTEIARQLQIPHSVVTRQRRQMGVTAVDRRAIQCPDKIKMLGTASDAELARLWGLTRENVRQARNRQGIPAFIPEGWKRVGRHKKNRGGEP